jgi:AcrR family transcriptional regulator
MSDSSGFYSRSRTDPLPTQTRKKRRRKPKQERSRETVESILEAAAQVLIREGYDKTSTNKIAQRAGVSIGSLYQYFPSKEAIVLELIDRHIEEMSGVVRARLSEAPHHSIECAVRSIVEALVDAKRVNPRLHAVFIEQVPRLGRLHRVLDLNRTLADLITVALASRPEPIRPKNLSKASFVLVHAVQAVTHALAVERPDYLGPDDADAVVEELTDMVTVYLTGEA